MNALFLYSALCLNKSDHISQFFLKPLDKEPAFCEVEWLYVQCHITFWFAKSQHIFLHSNINQIHNQRALRVTILSEFETASKENIHYCFEHSYVLSSTLDESLSIVSYANFHVT